MKRKEFDAGWKAAVEPVLAELKQWRLDHPAATLAEIEAALDQRLAPLRAELLRDVAQASAAADWSAADADERPACPDCAVPLARRGKHRRELLTAGDQPVPLERCYGACPRCGRGFFPSG